MNYVRSANSFRFVKILDRWVRGAVSSVKVALDGRRGRESSGPPILAGGPAVTVSKCTLAFVVLGAVACSSVSLRVLVDPTLAAGEVYAVRGATSRHWRQPLQFGGFSTRQTRTGESFAWSAGVFDVEAGVRTQPYRFVFVADDGGEREVECRSRTPILRHEDDDSSWEVAMGKTRLTCAVRGAAGGIETLSLAGTGVNMTGSMGRGDGRLTITSLRQVPDRNGRPRTLPGVVGYELRQGSRVVGSVDLLDAGYVYLAPGLSPALRQEVALAATALLLFDPE
ncbi:MAG: hypothetical protein K8J08_16680 [Thermoanaerobaculia bacterium]|nr:hypothetical protein [Thermoanaerobaculia bacterium]